MAGEGTVSLECNDQHIYHYECLSELLDNGVRKCTVCKAEIRVRNDSINE